MQSLDQLSDVNTTLLLTVSLAAQNSISHYWHKITDKTFAGIYHANAFDLAMMIPYFIVLFVLAIYGLHRYWLVYDYFAYAKNVPPSPPEVMDWPRVTIQLPIFNERYVIERLVEAVSHFDYPVIPPDCWTYRCWTIPRMKRSKSHVLAWSAMPRRACRSLTFIAPTAKATKPARWKMG